MEKEIFKKVRDSNILPNAKISENLKKIDLSWALTNTYGW